MKGESQSALKCKCKCKCNLRYDMMAEMAEMAEFSLQASVRRR